MKEEQHRKNEKNRGKTDQEKNAGKEEDDIGIIVTAFEFLITILE